MKKVNGYNLSKSNIESINQAAKLKKWSASLWLDDHLTEHFKPKKTDMAIKPKKAGFIKPDEREINSFAFTEKLNLEGFFDYYESNGWKVGKNVMKDWKASARGWSKRQGVFTKRIAPVDTSGQDWLDATSTNMFD